MMNFNSEQNVYNALIKGFIGENPAFDKAGRGVDIQLAKHFSNFQPGSDERNWFLSSIKYIASNIHKQNKNFVNNFLNFLFNSPYDVNIISKELNTSIKLLNNDAESTSIRGMLLRLLVNSGSQNAFVMSELSDIKNHDFWLWFDIVYPNNWEIASNNVKNYFLFGGELNGLFLRIPTIVSKVDQSKLNSAINEWAAVSDPVAKDKMLSFWNKIQSSRPSFKSAPTSTKRLDIDEDIANVFIFIKNKVKWSENPKGEAAWNGAV